MVIKSSELTPLTTVALVRLAENAGLPKGLVNVLAGFGPAAGQAAIKYEAVRKLGQWIENSGLDHETTGDRLTLTNPVETGNVFLRFSTL